MFIMSILLYIWIGLVVGFIVFGLPRISDTVAIFLARLTCQELVAIEAVSGSNVGDSWTSIVRTTAITGKRIAHRYPAMRIGVVTLNDDGTGHYCGPIRWKNL